MTGPTLDLAAHLSVDGAVAIAAVRGALALLNIQRRTGGIDDLTLRALAVRPLTVRPLTMRALTLSSLNLALSSLNLALSSLNLTLWSAALMRARSAAWRLGETWSGERKARRCREGGSEGAPGGSSGHGEHLIGGANAAR